MPCERGKKVLNQCAVAFRVAVTNPEKHTGSWAPYVLTSPKRRLKGNIKVLWSYMRGYRLHCYGFTITGSLVSLTSKSLSDLAPWALQPSSLISRQIWTAVAAPRVISQQESSRRPPLIILLLSWTDNRNASSSMTAFAARHLCVGVLISP